MLSIEEPWTIEKVENDNLNNLHIYVRFRKGSKFKCETCGELCPVHDTVEKTWRHLNCFQYKTYIHCKVPRIKCNEDGVHLIEVPWAKKGSTFTSYFESIIVQLSRKMPVLTLSKIFGESNGKLWRVIHRFSREYVENLDFSKVTKIGLDETSKKGHSYLTVFIDLDTSKIIYIADGKKAATIDEFKEFFVKHNGIAENITDVTCDMNMGFKTGIKKNFKNSKITYDKFHVMKAVNEAVDNVRKKESSEQKELKKSRYIWLKNQKNLTSSQNEKLYKLSRMNLKTATAYRLKLAFQDIYNAKYTKEMAEVEIKEWLNWAVRSKIEPIKKLARMIGSKLDGILNYYETGLTNAVLEGTNSLIQSAKSRARGYANTDNFKSMIYLMNSGYGVV